MESWLIKKSMVTSMTKALCTIQRLWILSCRAYMTKARRSSAVTLTSSMQWSFTTGTQPDEATITVSLDMATPASGSSLTMKRLLWSIARTNCTYWLRKLISCSTRKSGFSRNKKNYQGVKALDWTSTKNLLLRKLLPQRNPLSKSTSISIRISIRSNLRRRPHSSPPRCRKTSKTSRRKNRRENPNNQQKNSSRKLLKQL